MDVFISDRKILKECHKFLMKMTHTMSIQNVYGCKVYLWRKIDQEYYRDIYIVFGPTLDYLRST